MDPGNRWLWRFDRRRLDAESIRDAMLAVSGSTRSAPGRGRTRFRRSEQWPWTQHNAFKAVYPSDQRSVFLMTQRLIKHPYLAIFDGPDTNTSTDVRSRSTVPLQALFLMNNPFVQEQASALATRILREESTTEGRLERGWKLAWGRPPTPAERDRATRYLASCEAVLEPSDLALDKVAIARSGPAWRGILITANEFLYID